ncbi:MAG: hypothetical protein DRQ02_01405 [Candidatus Latescibacterota bacterium]|nr:MAG: hypothetical protein DRQ02_01405 [Candidatus Latescibacterota bacterium]
MLFTIKAMVMHQDDDDKLVYRLYRCPWDGDADNLVPQGHQIANMEDVCKVLFPSLALVGRPG